MGVVQPAQGEVADVVATPPHNPRLRYAIKTALALMLAYLLPMSLGWPQPQTAATTVMLIAVTGIVSESLQKGVLRALGTIVGAMTYSHCPIPAGQNAVPGMRFSTGGTLHLSLQRLSGRQYSLHAGRGSHHNGHG